MSKEEIDKNTFSESDKISPRTKWFEWYVEKLDKHSIRKKASEDIRYQCPCCHYKTLSKRGAFDICPVCFWEDDGQDDHDADVVRGGPNGSLSLTQARANFKEFGACEKRFIKSVRSPLHEET